eukprot:CAMPEP_0177727504 /NCGR_PEP_ID=MMETSP0484_2-20121128/20359_1 /TAXON_ID=354590 /ORGANISM="Rhodomonas lens, Strain RHODO" /LENGTH=133 /DNA_ID=CAMNT_0019240167 /DNA_START=26 /DNA_END=424 /DNA_ORIENTATION=-
MTNSRDSSLHGLAGAFLQSACSSRRSSGSNILVSGIEKLGESLRTLSVTKPRKQVAFDAEVDVRLFASEKDVQHKQKQQQASIAAARNLSTITSWGACMQSTTCPGCSIPVSTSTEATLSAGGERETCHNRKW